MEKVDSLLYGGTLLDGRGGEPLDVDIAVTGGRVVAIEPWGQIPRARAGDAIDCRGLIVCPGFLDTHSHSDLKVLTEPDLPK